MVKIKRLIGVLTVAALLAVSLVAVMGTPALAKHNETPNEGGVVVLEGDAPDCVGGTCGGVINLDPNGDGPNCDGGNCGGSICAGDTCGSCEDGNCGGSISIGGMRKHDMDKDKDRVGAGGGRQLPRTGATLPTGSTLALGLGMILVGALFTYLGSPSAKLAGAVKGYAPKRRM